MIVKVFSVYDSKAAAYMAPQYYHTSGIAERAFKQAVNESGTCFFNNPEDYTLFELGTFDDSTATFAVHVAPIVTVAALQLKASG